VTDPITLSNRMIDEGAVLEVPNRITQELTEVAPGVAVVESFSHVWALDSGAGLVLFDTSGAGTGRQVVDAVRGWRTDAVDTIVYTHGHVDHVGGSGAFVADADARGHRRPSVVAHEAVLERFARYRRTNDFNLLVNRRQFGGVRPTHGLGIGGLGGRFLPDDAAEPDRTYDRRAGLRVGDVSLELHHALGETDDHTWAWEPERGLVLCGDLITWVFPNAGNPQKVQRYADEWAAALRAMAALRPEMVLPAHGLPVAGADRVQRVLGDVAEALEHLVEETLRLMNDGADLDTVVHTVRVPSHLADRPYLMPIYDEPEFVVRNIWRRFGGWWDGDPSSLKPAPRADLGVELAALAGGPERLAARAAELADAGDLRLACQLVELAAESDPTNRAVHEIRAAVYGRRRDAELSLMAKGIYAGAVRESQAVLEAPH
jgi:alkyl sulfatase BDS1-like metallo-beta-lactamase superfamily hydrolase